MKKILQIVTVAALVILPTMAKAQNTVTVADGTTTNTYVPVYGYYADAYLRSQSIYPASMLTAISTGDALLQMTFYSSSYSVDWGDVEFEVKLGEVTETTLTAFSTATLTTVYTGSLSINASGLMQFEFDNPYTYGGGNLLLEVDLVEPDQYYSAAFYGTTGSSWQGYSYDSVSGIEGNAYTFLPKVTIAYGDVPTCAKVSGLAVDSVSQTSVSLSWSDTVNSGATYSVYDMNDTTLLASGLTAMSTTVNGLAASTHYVLGVVANCSATDASFFATVSAMTECASVALPYTDTFDPATTLFDCWTRVTTNTYNDIILDGGAMRFSSYSGSGLTDYHQYAYSPELVYSGTEDSLWFAVSYVTYGESDTLWFGYTTSDNPTASDYLWSTDGYSTDYGDNGFYVTTIPATATHVAVMYNGNYAYYAWVDELTVSDQPILGPAPDSMVVILAVADPTLGTTNPVPGTYVIYEDDNAISITATPYAGSYFIGWLEEYNYMGYSYADTIYSNEITAGGSYAFFGGMTFTFTALFSGENPYADDSVTVVLAVNDTTMGSVSPAPGTYTYYYGDTMTFVATPADGYFFSGWEVTAEYDGESETATLPYPYFGPTFSEMVDAGLLGYTFYFTALFTEDSIPEVSTDVFTLVCGVNNPAYGTTNPVPGTYTYGEGDAVSMVAEPNDGYYVESWGYKLEYMGITFIDTTLGYPVNDFIGTFLADEGAYIVDESDLGMTITLIANFAAGESPVVNDDVTIITAVNDASMGTITPAPGTHTYHVGDIVYISATANAGHYLHSIHITLSHPLYGLIEDETLMADEIDFSEPLEIEEEDLGFVFSITAIFAVNGQDPPIGITEAEAGNVTVSCSEGLIHVAGAEGRQVSLYDITGRQLGSKDKAGEVVFNAPASGVYVVRVGATAYRVVVAR